MDIIKSVTLGVVQGLTEFLPISSTAHLQIVPRLLGWADPGAPYSAVIQLGTVAAVIVYFWKDLLGIVTGFVRSLTHKEARNTLEARLGWALIIGTVPVVVAALLLKKLIETQFRSLWVVATMFIVMATLLLLAEIIAKHKRGIETVTPQDGLLVGLAQAFALVPGSSRSGSTLTMALFLGFTREAAARFSFLLSVPATALAGLYELYDKYYKHRNEPPDAGIIPWTTPDLIVGTLVSGIVGYACIALLLRFLRTNSTLVFVVYRYVVGAILLYLLWSGRLSAFYGG